MTTNAPFVIKPELVDIAKAYRNAAMIADFVMPRKGVGKQEFSYLVYNRPERYRIPETMVGRKSRPNPVEFGATEETGQTVDYALDSPVPAADEANAPPNFDPRGNAVEGVMELVELDREVRTATIVHSAATYPTGYKIQLSGTDQFSDYTNSDPIGVINTGLDAAEVRPNIAVMNGPTWTKLRAHPDIVSAILGNSGTKGIVSRAAVADLFELDEILVGRAKYNAANLGQTASYTNVWGKHIALLHRNVMANNQRGLTFGLTFQWGDRVSGEIVDPNLGMRGGVWVRAGESVVEKVIAADAAYFIEDAVA